MRSDERERAAAWIGRALPRLQGLDVVWAIDAALELKARGGAFGPGDVEEIIEQRRAHEARKTAERELRRREEGA